MIHSVARPLEVVSPPRFWHREGSMLAPQWQVLRNYSSSTRTSPYLLNIVVLRTP